MKNNMLTLTLNLENLSEDERAKLLELTEKANKPISKVWKPKEREGYCAIGYDGHIETEAWTNHKLDKALWEYGNCYPTQKAAEFALQRQKVYTALQRYAEEHNTEKIDWNNRNQYKYYIWYTHIDTPCAPNTSHLEVSMVNIHQEMGTIYFTSPEAAKDAIKEIGEDNIKKYLFGIE